MSTELLKTPGYKSKLFGRKWKVSILVPINSEECTSNSSLSEYMEYVVSDSSHENTSLRVTFNIQKFGWVCPNFSEISIYNLRTDLENIMIESNGCKVRVEAGYVGDDSAYGLIYDSPVWQPLWEREDNVTMKLTLRCIDAMDLIKDNWISMPGTAGQYQKDMIKEMARTSLVPINLADDDISEGMPDRKLPRARTFFGSTMDYLRLYSQLGGTFPSVIDGNIVLHRLQDKLPAGTEQNALVISPGEGGLIGTPQQTQDGVTFTCLLNPNITVFKPPMLIKLDNSKIRAMSYQLGQTYSRLDQDWMYRVLGVTHVGDTRGQEWYSEVVGANQDMDGMLPLQFKNEQWIAT